MYLRLGTTDIKYSSEVDDFMIISEVINSSTSLDRPTIVRTGDELDIWFGKNFNSRSYFDELIKSGVSLYLHKPISPINNYYNISYVDYSNYTVSELIYDKNEITKLEEGVLYRIVESGGVYSEYINEGVTLITYNKYIFILNDLVNIDQLPQNIDKGDSFSLNYRETLLINNNTYVGPEHCYPRYFGDSVNNYYKYIIDKDTLLSNLPNLERIDLGYETLSIDIIIDENIDFKKAGQYILIKTPKERVMVWFRYNSSRIPAVSNNYYDTNIPIDVTDSSDTDEIINKLINEFLNLGYKIKDDELEPNKYTLYSSFVIDSIYFYDISGIDIIPNQRVTYDILFILSEGKGRIEFISKTIGKSEIDGEISISIKILGSDLYRITINRFNYSEIFEGSLFSDNRLDLIITRESKLVNCNILESYLDDDGLLQYYKNDDPKSKLLEGTWKLSGIVKNEEYTKEMYWKSLESIFDGEVMIDYFLIPDIKNYIVDKQNNDYSYYIEYTNLLNISKNNPCQFLIQNNYINNDYLFNYTEDVDNKLIYFFNQIKYLGNERPGYYLFLKNLLSDIYMCSEKEVIYDFPNKDPYNINDLEKKLIKYKCNYLVNNNHYIYYKNYQNGEVYNTTIWMRFCLGKIHRELEKNKWSFLSKKTTGDIERSITSILDRIKNTFSIIRNIEISDFIVDFRNNKISLSINTSVSDLINNDIEFDITLNYNI